MVEEVHQEYIKGQISSYNFIQIHMSLLHVNIFMGIHTYEPNLTISQHHNLLKSFLK